MKRALSSAAVALSSRFDFNRDGKVNALDLAALKQNLNRRLALPGVPATMAAAIPVAARDDAMEETGRRRASWAKPEAWWRGWGVVGRFRRFFA